MLRDVSPGGRARERERVLVNLSDVPLIQTALNAYAAGLRRQARSRALRGGSYRMAREETRKEAARAASLASQIGRR